LAKALKCWAGRGDDGGAEEEGGSRGRAHSIGVGGGFTSLGKKKGAGSALHVRGGEATWPRVNIDVSIGGRGNGGENGNRRVRRQVHDVIWWGLTNKWKSSECKRPVCGRRFEKGGEDEKSAGGGGKSYGKRH